MKAKYMLNFPHNIVGQPITYHLIKDYDLKINILNAEISDDKHGYLLIDLWGTEDNLKGGITYLEGLNIVCRPFQKQLAFDHDNCVDCGSCSGVCHSDALTINNPERKLEYNPDNCTVCGLCITACPLQLFALNYTEQV